MHPGNILKWREKTTLKSPHQTDLGCFEIGSFRGGILKVARKSPVSRIYLTHPSLAWCRVVLKGWSQPNSTNITWELVRNTISWAPSQACWIRNSGDRTHQPVFITLPVILIKCETTTLMLCIFQSMCASLSHQLPTSILSNRQFYTRGHWGLDEKCAHPRLNSTLASQLEPGIPTPGPRHSEFLHHQLSS